ncbi:MAG: hypothetical protein ACP5KJ_03925 [Candidatus Micrarchaeia archaeon]
MAYTDSLISTGVDQLINLVYRSKRIKVDDASRQLGLAAKVIEEWARVLEDEGIIKLEYQFSTIYLVWAGGIVKEPEGAKEILLERDLLITEVESLSTKVNALLSESRTAGKNLASVVKEISSVSEGVKKSVDTISAVKKESSKAGKEASEILAQIESLMKQVNSKISEYEKLFSESVESTSKERERIQSVMSDYEHLREDLRQQMVLLENSRKSISERLDELSKIDAEIGKRLDTYATILEGKFSKEMEEARNEFEVLRNNYSKLSESLENRLNEMRLALKTIEEFNKEVETLEEKISEDVIARRYAELKNIMDMLTGLEDEEERLDKKLQLLLKELRSIKIEVSPLSNEETARKVEDAKGKISTAKRELTAIEQKRYELAELMKRIKGNK